MATVSSASQVARLQVTWEDFGNRCRLLAERHPRLDMVYGVPTGGCFVARWVADNLAIGSRTGCPFLTSLPESPEGVLVVDDLVDSGATLKPYHDRGYTIDALFRKPHSPFNLAPEAVATSAWVVFPWEHDGEPTDAVKRLLEFIGEDPARDGLTDTPGRVCRALEEMTAGHRMDPAEILARSFEAPYDEMVVLRGIRFASLCEHHLMPFAGTADVGYIPTGRVVGLSKLARVVECFSRRLQIQERLTTQIANTINLTLRPKGVGVVLRASHNCMGCRGVRQPDSEMVTSALLGCFREDPRARSEFLGLTRTA